MKKARHFTILILCLIAIHFILSSDQVFAARSDVEAFVTRFYQQCLGRDPEPQGLNNWTNHLLNGTLCGADVANGFIFSLEFSQKNTSDDEFLYVLYRAFFNRDPDIGGFVNWQSILSGAPVGDRATRQLVLNGFLNSEEFIILCNRYGIVPIPNITLDGSLNCQFPR